MRDNTQLLINDIWKVGVKLFGGCIIQGAYDVVLGPVSSNQ